MPSCNASVGRYRSVVGCDSIRLGVRVPVHQLGSLRNSTATYNRDKELCINDRVLSMPAVPSDTEEWEAEELVEDAFSGGNLDAALLGNACSATADALDGISLVFVDASHVGPEPVPNSVSFCLMDEYG